MTYKSTTMKLPEIRVTDLFKRDPGDLVPLMSSIKARGLLHPIIVTPEGELIAGYRRYLACTKLGWKEIDVRVVIAD